jgi:hypothetical protein
VKLCHIAVLGAVGWYLMCPSVRDFCRRRSYGFLDCIYDYHVNSDTPLNQWEKLGTFDLKTECKDNIGPNSSVKTGTCKCITTDDPRLQHSPFWHRRRRAAHWYHLHQSAYPSANVLPPPWVNSLTQKGDQVKNCRCSAGAAYSATGRASH